MLAKAHIYEAYPEFVRSASPSLIYVGPGRPQHVPNYWWVVVAFATLSAAVEVAIVVPLSHRSASPYDVLAVKCKLPKQPKKGGKKGLTMRTRK